MHGFGWLRIFALAGLSLVVVGPARELKDHEEPILPVDLQRTGPLAPTWTKHKTTIKALRVRLNGLGARTHANWILFRLPFDVRDRERNRLRGVNFNIRSDSRADVAALILGSICAGFPDEGGPDNWSSYTTNGIVWTQRFSWHLAPPSDDPTILGLNVPTRVANYVACGWDEGHLADPENWSLDIRWEDR